MPDDNRLAGIGDQLENNESDEPEESTESDDSGDYNNVRESNESQDSKASDASGAGVKDEPAAFSYEDTEKTTVYGTEETLSTYSQALDIARARAIEEHGLDEIEARELHNAALLEGAENVDAIAARVAEERDD